MTRTILLGTAGGPAPKAARNAPAQCVVVNDQTYVIDCGNGVARQLVLAGIPLSSVRAAFITHHHSDHNADLGNLVLLAWMANLEHTVELYGPPPIGDIWSHFLAMSKPDVDIRTGDEGLPRLEEFGRPHDVSSPGAVYEDENVRVTCARVHHPPIEVALAYRLDTCEGQSIVFSGDSAPTESMVELAHGADILVHEAMHVPSARRMAETYNAATLLDHLLASHTSAEDAGRIASEAGVGRLVLSHLVPSDLPVDDETWIRAAQSRFDGEVIVGSDLMVLE